MTASALPMPVALLECHPRSEQLFLPMGEARCLVVVAPRLADGSPDLASLQAFTSSPGQGLIYGRGVWHMPLAALDAPGSFLMGQWETGGPDDCLLHPLDDAVVIG